MKFLVQNTINTRIYAFAYTHTPYGFEIEMKLINDPAQTRICQNVSMNNGRNLSIAVLFPLKLTSTELSTLIEMEFGIILMEIILYINFPP